MAGSIPQVNQRDHGTSLCLGVSNFGIGKGKQAAEVFVAAISRMNRENMELFLNESRGYRVFHERVDGDDALRYGIVIPGKKDVEKVRPGGNGHDLSLVFPHLVKSYHSGPGNHAHIYAALPGEVNSKNHRSIKGDLRDYRVEVWDERQMAEICGTDDKSPIKIKCQNLARIAEYTINELKRLIHEPRGLFRLLLDPRTGVIFYEEGLVELEKVLPLINKKRKGVREISIRELSDICEEVK